MFSRVLGRLCVDGLGLPKPVPRAQHHPLCENVLAELGLRGGTPNDKKAIE
jgi:hypothetical protein